MKANTLVGLSVSLAATLLLHGRLAVPDADKDAAFRWLDTNADAMRSVSLDIWNTPELALREYKSSRELMGYLESNGFRVEKGVAGMPTAFLASYGSGTPVIAIYGEYDALAGLSQKAESSVSPVVEGAPGHGCGHNLIGAGAAVAAVAVACLHQWKFFTSITLDSSKSGCT